VTSPRQVNRKVTPAELHLLELCWSSPRPAVRTGPSRRYGLTDRELAVLRLLAAGRLAAQPGHHELT